MIGIETKLTGDMASGLGKLEAKVREQALRAAGFAMATVVYDNAKANLIASPAVDKGVLLNALYRVHVDEASSDTKQVYRISWNKKTAPHGGFVEYGTSKMPAEPYMRPAFDQIDQAIEAGKAVIAERLKA